MTHAERQHRSRIYLAFGLVYFFWGSTYLGIGIAVRDIPPVLMAGTRFLVAGVVMLAFCRLFGKQCFSLTRVEYIQQAIIGVLLLSGGNIPLAWAEQYLPTGLSALLVSISPLWFLLFERFLLQEVRITRQALAGLALGFGGIIVLIWPKLQDALRGAGGMQMAAAGVLMFGSISWSSGSILSKRWRTSADPFTATGWQMTFAGLANTVVALGLGQHTRAHWTRPAVLAITYLIIAGSWIGFTAYIFLLNHVTAAKVSTYAYVNPVVAVALGWLFLHEKIDIFIAIGTVIIIASVVLVTTAKKAAVGAPTLPPVEAEAD